MSAPINDTSVTTTSGTSISELLAAVGPLRIEGDQGSWTAHSLDSVIKAVDWERKSQAMRTRSSVASVLRTISNHRLLSHDGRAS
jgi:hypothetical protein